MAQEKGWQANQEAVVHRPCVVCDTSSPRYSWTDYSGEAYCTTCGTPYQLKWGELAPGETYPRLNVDESAIPMLRRYWQETHSLNGLGQYLGMRDYPEQARGQQRMSEWWALHKAEYPEFDRG